MKTNSLVSRRDKSALFSGAGIAALSLAVLATPAYAQDAGQTDEAGDVTATEQDEEAPRATIIVSGSRIARPSLDSAVPVTSVAAEELLNDGALSLGDALNDLPSLRSTFTSSNSQRFIGTTGLSLLDLRGLGTSRTLVLVNGRRHVTASAGDFQVDVNTFPLELLERVDVVTGGSSAVYGSDAIAGVVNFVLQRDYEGIELNGQAGISSREDNGRFSISGKFGKNFADGRGNIAVVGEYTKIDRVFNSQRPDISGFGIGFTNFEQTDDLSDEGITNSDGIPDSTLQNSLFLDFISEGGTVGNFCVSNPSLQPLTCQPDGNEIRYRFGTDGRLFNEANQVFPSGNAIGGTGTSLSDGTLIPDIERYNFNVLAHFDVSDAFRPYAEFKYARIESLGQGTPSFFNGFCNGLTGASGLNPSCFDGSTSAAFFVPFDNAFLHPDDAATIEAIQDELLGAFGIPPGNSQGFTINRNNTDFGTRNDSVKRQTYRVVAGVEGDISSNTKYDLSFTFGRYNSRLDATNDLIFQRARNAVDAVFDPNNPGNIVCRINVDADPNNNDPTCIPLNILGFGAPDPAAVASINQTAHLFEKARQYDVLGYISTDSSNLFELPGGPIALVAGFEWRRETAFSEPDPLSASGATFFNAFDVFDPPALEVREIFGEIRLPILADVPFFEELELSAAGRISDYNSGAGNTGTTYAYNGNLVWAPVSDIRLRANYSRSVRAPTLSDLFAAQTQNFLFFDDPCDIDFINSGSGTRESNCRAAGVPVGFDDQVTGNRAVLQGGNPLLSEETSNSYTLGAVIQPHFVPGFTFTVDYYDITVKKVIANLSPQAILNNCFDATDLDNAFCRQVNPRQPDGSLDNDAALILGPVNFAKLTARGLDFDMRYIKTFDNSDRLSLRLIATRVLERTNFLDEQNPDLPNRVRNELGDPNWAANFNASYRKGAVTLSYSARFVGKQFIGAAENFVSSTQVCPSSGSSAGLIPRTDTPCTPGDLVTAPPLNPDAFAEIKYPDRLFQDIRLDWQVEDDFQFYFGVDNVTDELPPFGLTGAGAGSGIFNNTGRFYYAGFTANF